MLGAVGVYGVASYAVERRRAEFGVRLALGASPARVRRDVLWSGLSPVVIGVVVGIGMAVGLAQALNRFLRWSEPHGSGEFRSGGGCVAVCGRYRRTRACCACWAYRSDGRVAGGLTNANGVTPRVAFKTAVRT